MPRSGIGRPAKRNVAPDMFENNEIHFELCLSASSASTTSVRSAPTTAGWAPSGLGTPPPRATKAACAPAAMRTGDIPGVGRDQAQLVDVDPATVGDHEVRRGEGLERTHLVGGE